MLFKFDSQDDADRVLRDGPWNIMNAHVVARSWLRWLNYKEVNMNLCDVWIQFHDVPRNAMNLRNAFKFGAKMGCVLAVEKPMVDGCVTQTFV